MFRRVSAFDGAVYAMFHTANAFFVLDNVSPKTHKGVVLQLAKYTKFEKLSKDEVRSIAHGSTIRVRCDCDIEVIFDAGEVGGLINEAEHFVGRIEEVIRDA